MVPLGKKDWRRTVGICTDNPGMQELFADAMRLREADRKSPAPAPRKAAGPIMILLDTDHLSVLTDQRAAGNAALFQRLESAQEPLAIPNAKPVKPFRPWKASTQARIWSMFNSAGRQRVR
jgi:hypothetical protein